MFLTYKAKNSVFPKIHSLSKQFCTIFILWKTYHSHQTFPTCQSWHQLFILWKTYHCGELFTQWMGFSTTLVKGLKVHSNVKEGRKGSMHAGRCCDDSRVILQMFFPVWFLFCPVLNSSVVTTTLFLSPIFLLISNLIDKLRLHQFLATCLS